MAAWAFLGITVLTAAMAVMSVRQIAVWKDSVTLWSREIELYQIFPAFVNRADAYLKIDKFEDAVRDFYVSIDTSTHGDVLPGEGLGMLYFRRGLAYQGAGDITASIDDFTRSIVLNPRNPQAYNSRGSCYMAIGGYVMAIADCRKALELDPQNPVIYFNLGLAYQDSGKQDAAVENMRKAAGLGLKEALEHLDLAGNLPK